MDAYKKCNLYINLGKVTSLWAHLRLNCLKLWCAKKKPRGWHPSSLYWGNTNVEHPTASDLQAKTTFFSLFSQVRGNEARNIFKKQPIRLPEPSTKSVSCFSTTLSVRLNINLMLILSDKHSSCTERNVDESEVFPDEMWTRRAAVARSDHAAPWDPAERMFTPTRAHAHALTP